jgi:7-carboxy-7-deazaguanine synthase
MERTFPVVELFGPTIQGEGALIGQRSHFVRFGGCSFRCSWCDSLHAVEPELIKKHSTMMTATEIARGVRDLPPSPWVTLSGGDPAIWDLDDLVRNLRFAVHYNDEPGAVFKIAVETQGAVFREWLSIPHRVTLSPKPPSSGMSDRNRMEVIQEIIRRRTAWGHNGTVLKTVAFNHDDLMFAKNLHQRFPGVPFYISAGTLPAGEYSPEGDALRQSICEGLRELVEQIITIPEFANVTILPQMHVLLWGRKKGV